MRTLTMAALLFAGCKKDGTPKTAAETVHPSLVYAIEKDGKRSHIMGTCHLPLALEDRVDPTLIDEARELWVEASIDQIDLNAVLDMMWDSQRSNSEELGREAFARLTRKTGLQAPASMAEHMQPWALAVILGLSDVVPKKVASQLKGEDGPPVLDRAVLDRARAADVPVRTVEQIQEQLDMFAAQPVDLKAMLEPDEATRTANGQAVATMLDLCTTNDLSRLDPSMYAADGENGWLLVDRNARWVPQLLPALEQGGAFIAVGGLHLPGEHGLLKAFEDAGYTVSNLPRPVPPEPPVPYTPSPPAPFELVPIEQRDAGMLAGAQAACQDGQVFRTCFYPEQDACIAAMKHDLGLCADASFSSLADMAGAATDQGFAGCTLAGAIAEHIVHGWPEREACAPLKAAVDNAMKAYGAGGAPTR